MRVISGVNKARAGGAGGQRVRRSEMCRRSARRSRN